jgi:hypothetical protein
MVARFMEGVDPDYEEFIEEQFRLLLTEYPAGILDRVPKLSAKSKAAILQDVAKDAQGIHDQLVHSLQLVRENYFVSPVTDVVDWLPKDRIAEMAEALVSLTSLKRRVSLQAETVGGPIDVALISKGDGFIWIRHKHYFDPSLNAHFFASRYGATPR